MPLKTERVTLDLDGDHYEVTVSRATAAIGRDHATMQSQMYDEIFNNKIPVEDHGLEYMRVTCVSAAISSGGFDFPPDLATFKSLPEQFIAQWYETVRALNPHWWAVEEASEDAIKKPTESTPS